jgi:hypothetical protein
MNATELRETALIAIQKWDAKAAKKKGYNVYALEIATAKIDDFINEYEILAGCEKPDALKIAILRCFIGRLATQVSKEFGIKLTDNELKFGVRGIGLEGNW